MKSTQIRNGNKLWYLQNFLLYVAHNLAFWTNVNLRQSKVILYTCYLAPLSIDQASFLFLQVTGKIWNDETYEDLWTIKNLI